MSASTENTTPEFTIVRTFNAPQEMLWRAWTQEKELAHWLKPFGVSTESIHFDVEAGGSLRYTMTNDETGEKFPTGGVFLEVQPMDRLVFTWGEPDTPVDAAAVITLDFIARGEQTELVFHLRGIEGAPGDNNVYDGWDQALTNFGSHLAVMSG